MGKLHAESTAADTMSSKTIQPTIEQIRLAKLCDDKKSDDMSDVREKCRKVVETTRCDEFLALTALHDCNGSVQEAVMKILEGGLKNEWQTTNKKAKKLRGGDTSESRLSPSRNHLADQNDDPAAEALDNDHHRHNGLSSSAGFGGFRGRRRANDASNDGSSSGRGRGRGMASRGGFRGRGDFSNDREHSSDRSGGANARRPGRGGFRGGSSVGFGGFTNFNSNTNSSSNEHSRPNRGGDYNRGGSSRNFEQNNSTGNAKDNFVCGNWNDTNNTWNNNMAQQGGGGGATTTNNTWAAESTATPKDNDLSIGQWKDVAVGDAATTWGSDSRRHPRRDAERRGGPRGTNDFNRRHPQRPNASTNGPSAGNVGPDDWNHDDWGEEEDWQKMTNRVFTNVKVQQSVISVSQSPSSVGAHQQPVSSPPQSNLGPNKPDDYSGSPNQPGSGAETGLGGQVRGESIDVNMLFGQQQKPDHKSVDSNHTGTDGGGSWSKQATDTLKSELGIGKMASSNAMDLQMNQHLARTQQQQRPGYASTKPVASKVEMPSSVSTMGGGQLDVEFGEFGGGSSNNTTMKMRSDLEDQPQNYFGDFGSSVAYGAADHRGGLSSNQLKESPVSLYHQQQQQRTPAKDQQIGSSDTSGENAKDARTHLSASQLDAPVPPGYGARPQQQDGGVYGAAAAGQVRSPSAQQQQKSQIMCTPQPQSGVSAAQNAPQQRGYSNNVVSSSAADINMSQMRDSNVGPTVISLPASQQVYGQNSNMSYQSTTAMLNNRTSTVTSTTGKQQNMNTATIFNPATNQSYQQALAAAMPYIYQTADQNYMNALQFLSPAAGYPFSAALGALPFDFSTMNLRDSTQPALGGMNVDVKQYGRSDSNLLTGLAGGGLSATGSLNAPPGLAQSMQSASGQSAMGPTSNDQAAAAAQLLTQAAAYHHPAAAAYPLMQATAPFYTPFVLPTVTNTSSSSANPAVNHQYNKANGMFAASQPLFYGNQDLLAQEYNKSLYQHHGMGLQQQQQQTVNQQQGQPKQQQTTNNAQQQDLANKGYPSASLKMFENKAFQQSTATPPPGMGGVTFPPGATAAFHSGQSAYGAAAYAAAAGAPQYMSHQISMIPPNMAAAAAQAAQQQQTQQSVSQNDLMANAGQRGGPAGANSKGGANIYATKAAPYWAS